MWLTRLPLNLRSREVMRDLGDVQSMHSRLMSLFPQSDGEGARRSFQVLYRVEDAGDQPLQVLLQCALEPSVVGLPSDYLREAGGGYGCTSLLPLIERMTAGAPFIFRLRANTTKKIHSFDSDGTRRKNGTRVPIKDLELEAWALRKLEQAGLEVIDSQGGRQLKAVGEPNRFGFKPGGTKLTLASTLFEGLVAVRDADLVRLTLEQGVGAAKAYGFGLLSLAPAGDRGEP